MKFKTLAVSSLACFLLSACEKSSSPKPIPGKAITSFQFQEIDPEGAIVDIQDDSILITIPGNTSLSSLTPVISYQGKIVSPTGKTALNFNEVVKFIVTGTDNTTKEYHVKVRRRPVLYLGAWQHFYALDTKDGHILWQIASAANFAYSNPFVSGDTVFAGAIDGNMYALNARTGATIWKKYFSSTGIEGPSIVANGTLYFGTNDDDFFALDPATGNTKWSFKTGGNISTKPVIFNNAVIFGSSDGNVYALDTTSGTQVWKKTIGFMVSSAPVLHNGVIFIGTRSSGLYALDAATGSTKWMYNTGGISMESAICGISNGTVYAAGSYNFYTDPMPAGSLYAINEETGELKLEALDSLGFTGPLSVNNDTVYVPADNGFFYAVNGKTGETIWSILSYSNGAAGAVRNGVIYIPSGGTGYVHALNAKNGQSIWSTPISQNDIITSDPALGKIAKKYPVSLGF